MFNEKIQVAYVYNAISRLRRITLRQWRSWGTDRSSTVFIGDQLFTDVWGANVAVFRAF